MLGARSSHSICLPAVLSPGHLWASAVPESRDPARALALRVQQQEYNSLRSCWEHLLKRVLGLCPPDSTGVFRKPGGVLVLP